MLDFQITVGNSTYNCISDWNCFPMRFSIGAAQPRLSLVEVPYRDGTLDMSEAVSGKVTYSNREISIPIIINSASPMTTYNVIAGLVNGKQCKLKFNGYDTSYFQGRIRMGQLETKDNKWEFTMNMTAYPYRLTDITETFSSPTSRTIVNSGSAEVIPTITTTRQITVSLNDRASVTIPAGTITDAMFQLKAGNNTFVSSGDAQVTIKFSEKKL